MPEDKVQVIVELIKKGELGSAVDELEKLAKSGAKSSMTMEDLAKKARNAFAVFGGVSLLKAALNEFVESEKAVARLNAALRSTGQYTPETSRQLREMADSIKEITGIQDEAILGVISKLTALGAKRDDVYRLTMAVMDLATLLDRDLSRATVAMGRALQGEFGSFTELGFKVKDTASATENFNSILGQLEAKAGGQAKASMQSLAGSIEASKNQIKDATKELGAWLAKALEVAGAIGRGIGEASTAGALSKSRAELEKMHDKLRASLREEIEKLRQEKWISDDTAVALRNHMAKAFEPDTRYEPQAPGAWAPGRTISTRNLQREEDALSFVNAYVYPQGLSKSAAPAPAVSKPVGSTGLSQADAAKAKADAEKMWEDAYDIETETEEQRQKNWDEQLKRNEEQTAAIKEVDAMERSLEDQRMALHYTGLDREMFQARINHEERVRQIQDLKFEDEGRYLRLMELEDQLYGVEQQRILHERSFAAEMKASLIDIGKTGVQSFSQGLGTAMVDAFSEGDKAFQRFAANFLRSIAEMILQTMILLMIRMALKSIPGIGAMLGGGGQVGSDSAYQGGMTGAKGLQVMGAALGGMVLAAGGVEGVAAVDKPTFFPKFNTLAGEAGRELLTVLSRPYEAMVMGVPATIGMAGERQLAILDYGKLMAGVGVPRKLQVGGMAGAVDAAGPGGRGADARLSGEAVVRVELGPDLEGRIVRNSIQGAKTEVTQDLQKDTPIARATQQLVR